MRGRTESILVNFMCTIIIFLFLKGNKNTSFWLVDNFILCFCKVYILFHCLFFLFIYLFLKENRCDIWHRFLLMQWWWKTSERRKLELTCFKRRFLKPRYTIYLLISIDGMQFFKSVFLLLWKIDTGGK